MFFIKFKQISFLFLFLFSSKILSEGFVAGTLVKTKSGYVPIETLKSHDSVLTYNFKSKKAEESKVTAVKISNGYEAISLTVNNTQVTVSPEHKFYCPMNNKRWTLAKDMETGDYTVSGVKDLIKIDNAALMRSDEIFYSLAIANNHNYFISKQDILVHNFFFTIPLFTWIIGEGLVWLGLGSIVSAFTAVVINEVAKNNGIDCGGLTKLGDIVVSFDGSDRNKIHHIINDPKHGFLSSCNAGGPDEDPDEWIKRIKQTVDDANKNPDKFPKEDDISTKWRSSNPNFGELIVRVFKVEGMMKLSTAFLRKLNK